MTRFCAACKKEHDCNVKKCPVCGAKMEKRYTEEELEEIRKTNDDFTVINTFLL